MYLVIIAWLYVTLMMAVAEASSTTGTVLGGIITFVLYGALPLALVTYLLATPARRKARRRAEAEQALQAQQPSPSPVSPADLATTALQPDASGQTPTAAQTMLVAPVRKEM